MSNAQQGGGEGGVDTSVLVPESDGSRLAKVLLAMAQFWKQFQPIDAPVTLTNTYRK